MNNTCNTNSVVSICNIEWVLHMDIYNYYIALFTELSWHNLYGLHREFTICHGESDRQYTRLYTGTARRRATGALLDWRRG